MYTRLVQLLSPKNSTAPFSKEKPRLSGCFFLGSSGFTELQYPHLFLPSGLEEEVKPSEYECNKLFLPSDITIPMFKKPCKGYSIFIYRVDEDMGIEELEDGTDEVIWQDSLLLFYPFEHDGVKYVITQCHAIIGGDFEISKPIPHEIKELSGGNDEYIDLWSEMVTEKYLIDLDSYAVERKL